MKIVGITGPSGSGKTAVSHIARNLGYYVIDCDKTAREAAKNATVLDRLEKAFCGVVKNGKLDRKLLAEKAFSSKERTQTLNDIMLPEICKQIKCEISSAEEDGVELVLLDAPTLFESGLDEICDSIIAVLADEKTRAERLVERDKLDEKQLKSRLSASKPDEFYTGKTENIIYNNGNFEEYIIAAEKMLKGELLWKKKINPREHF